MTPAMMPEDKGALEARAMPKQRGRATKKTTSDETRSVENLFMKKSRKKIKELDLGNQQMDGGGFARMT